MSIPYLKIAGLVAVAAIVGATLCIVSLDGAKFSVNCTSADVAAFMRSAPR